MGKPFNKFSVIHTAAPESITITHTFIKFGNKLHRQLVEFRWAIYYGDRKNKSLQMDYFTLLQDIKGKNKVLGLINLLHLCFWTHVCVYLKYFGSAMFI